MAEESTLARPYAEAVFEMARESDRLAEWGEALQTLSAIAGNEDVAELMGNPQIEDSNLAHAVIEVAGDVLDDKAKNLVRLLAENDRLTLLPAIAEQYEALRADAENRVDVQVTAATDINDEQRQQLTKVLEKRLARSVNLTVQTDPELIGGAVIRAGDLVIDGSVRAQLARMSQTLAH